MKLVVTTLDTVDLGIILPLCNLNLDDHLRPVSYWKLVVNLVFNFIKNSFYFIIATINTDPGFFHPVTMESVFWITLGHKNLFPHPDHNKIACTTYHTQLT